MTTKYNTGKYVCSLSPELLERAKNELNEDPSRREEAVEILRQWLIKQPHINGRTDDSFLVKYLRVSKWSVERAKERLENYYTMKTALPDWFLNEDFDSPRIQEILKLGTVLLLGYDKQGRRVMMFRAGCYDPSKYTLDELFKVNNFVCDLALMDEQTQVCGTVFVGEMSGMTGAHMAQFTPLMAKKAMALWQNGMPFRIKGLNYYKTPTFFDILFNMVKVFMKDKLLKRVHIHGNSLESLYQEVPKEILPKELGGDAGDIATLTDKLISDLKSNQDYFREDRAYKVDESKRLGKPKTQEDLFGVDGTFRKLNID